MSQVTEMQDRLKGLLSDTLGVVITVAEKELVEADLLVRPEICTSGHILHGGAVMAFADTLGAVGTTLNLREGQGTATIESKTNFFAAGPEGETVHARCVPLHRGGRTQVWQTNITRADGRLVAQVTQTQMVLT